MNMRWAWTLPVLSVLATTAATGPAWAQGGGDPAFQAAMQAQAYAQMAAAQQAAAGMYPPQAMFAQPAAPPASPGRHTGTFLVPNAAYPPAAMYPPAGIQQVAYMAPQPPVGDGLQPQAPAQLPMGATPDVYGSYGYAPADYGGGYAAPGYGQPMAPIYDQGYGQGYGGPMNDGQGYGQGMMDGGCPYCGGQGCPQCGGLFGHGHRGDGTWLPNGLLGDILGLVAPYPDGGCAAVRWFDFAVDYMMLKRDNTGRSDQVFATFGINGIPALSANQLDFGSYKPGFRLSAAYQIGPANSLEFTYFGQFNYTSAATVRAPVSGNLFSAFSNFGTAPFGGFAEFDNANFNQINYQSTFDSFEVNWRCRWMAPNCRYQGSWTVGVRHFILDEKFRYATSSAVNGVHDPFTGQLITPATSRDDTDTTNNLTGIQFGSDLWICVLPGLRLGGELQAGVYGNHMNINTTVGSNQVAGVFQERLTSNDVSFIGQANLLATYRINYQWTLRGGYQFLFVDGVALASENFNPLPPLVNQPRAPRINDNGDVFYHGWNVGLEFMW